MNAFEKEWVHQVVGFTVDGVQTKGINNIWVDPFTVSYENIIAVIIAVIY